MFTKTCNQRTTRHTHYPNHPRSRHGLPAKIKQDITAKNYLHRQRQRYRDPQLKWELKAKTQLNRNILHQQDEWDMFLDSLELKENSIYKLNKWLLHKRPAPHPLLGSHGLIFEASEKAEQIADSLEIWFSPNSGPEIAEVTTNTLFIKKTLSKN